MQGKVIVLAQQKGGAGKTTLAANLAVAFARAGKLVAVLDTDPQGSLGRWFMLRRQAGTGAAMEFGTASAWGVSYECEKLRREADIVLIDTPPKADADLRPALREADLIVVPVSSSLVDLWATEGVLDLARRESRKVMLVLNRMRGGSRLAAEVAEATGALGEAMAGTVLGQRVVYGEALGRGQGVLETPGNGGAAGREILALADEVLTAL